MILTFIQAERKVASLGVVANRLSASHLPQIRSTGRAANCGIHNRVCASHFQPQPTRAHFTPRLNYLLTLQSTARSQASITHSDFTSRGFIVARLVGSSYYCAIELPDAQASLNLEGGFIHPDFTFTNSTVDHDTWSSHQGPWVLKALSASTAQALCAGGHLQ